MIYDLLITKRANEHIDNIIAYLVNVLKNPGAARAVIADIEEAYNKLEYMAESLRYCDDVYLSKKGYRKIALSNHEYVILYIVEGSTVYVEGVFHMREEYIRKL